MRMERKTWKNIVKNNKVNSVDLRVCFQSHLAPNKSTENVCLSRKFFLEYENDEAVKRGKKKKKVQFESFIIQNDD